MLKRLATLCQQLYVHRKIRLVIATIFSVGKVLSSAGGTLFGLKETLATYGIDCPPTMALAGGLTALNATLTTANRAPPIYRKLLKGLPARPIAEPIEHYYQRLDGSRIDIPDEPTAITPIVDLVSSTSTLSNDALSTVSTGLYYLITSLCHLSLPFSALNAYLSATTLINEIYPDANKAAHLSFAYFVTISSMMSYCTFNLARMRRNVLRFCAGLDYRYTLGTFNLGTKTLVATLFSTIFGIIAGIGTAYLGAGKSLDLFPLTQDLSPDIKESLIISSVVASLFSSTFIFAVSCYDQIKAHLEPHLREANHFSIPLYAKILTLIDSSSNSMTGFIGVINLIDRLLDHSLNRLALILIGVLPLLNNIFMNYSLGLIGSQPTLKWLHAHCCSLADERLNMTTDSRRIIIENHPPPILVAAPELPPIAASTALPSSPRLALLQEQPWQVLSPQARPSAFFWNNQLPSTKTKEAEFDHQSAKILDNEAEGWSFSP